MSDNHTPPDCFRQEELEQFLAVQGRILEAVHYFTVNTPSGERLYALELVFDAGPSLLLDSDADEPAIRITSPEALVQVAENFRQAGLRMQLRDANRSSLWMPFLGKTLDGVLLSKNEEGLSLNDALLFDFGAEQVWVGLAEAAGLAVGVENKSMDSPEMT